MTQAEQMRHQRNQEAKALIGSRVGTAKAIFTQNSASGQMQTKAAPAKPVRNSIQSRINSLNNQHHETEPQTTVNSNEIIPEHQQLPAQQQVVVAAPVGQHYGDQPAIPSPVTEPTESVPLGTSQPAKKYTNGTSAAVQQPSNGLANVKIPAATTVDDEDEGDQYSTIKRSPHSKTAPSQVSTPDDEENSQLGGGATVSVTQQVMQEVIGQNDNELIPVEGVLYPDMLGDYGLKARALYDYQAGESTFS